MRPVRAIEHHTSHLRIFGSQLFFGLKLFSRSPAPLVWMVGVPTVLLILLGAAFGGSGETPQQLIWSREAPAAGIDEMFQQVLHEHGMKVEVLAPAEAEARWQSRKLPVLLEGKDGHYHLRMGAASSPLSRQFEASVQQGYLAAQVRAQGGSDLRRIPVTASKYGSGRDVPYAAYLLPGLMGLNLLTLGVFTTGFSDVTMRVRGGYRRLATTPLPRYIYLIAQLCVRLLLVIGAAAMLMLVGAVGFGVYNQGAYSSLFTLVILGAACFISLGYLLASFARTIESYDGVGNAVFLPMMLLSGVYFSLDAAPTWLRLGADVLPLAPLLHALRAVFNDGASLASQGPVLASVGTWTAVFFLLAVKRFRWV
jgi:ABC-2 type transport system permease protein